MKQLNKTAYRAPFQCIFNIDSLFYYIDFFLNKKESKVICMREFKIILLQTQSLSIKPLK
jgi:hypothetical protein